MSKINFYLITRNPLPSAATARPPAVRSLRSLGPPAARYARQTTPTWPPKLPNKTSRPSVKPRPQWPLCKSAIFQFSALGDLGGRIWGLPVPLNRGRWATFDLWHNPEKCLLLWFFDTENSANQLTASEATEAGLNRPKTSARVCKGCMQSYDLLALKLRPWWARIVMYRHNFFLSQVFF